MKIFNFLGVFGAIALVIVGCGGGAAAVDPGAADGTSTADTTDAPADPCDPLMPAGCTLPWPSNLYLKADATRKTGYTLTFGDKSLPADSAGKYVSPEPYKRLDGYSVGTSLLMMWPEIDLTGLAAESDPSKSLDKNAQILWLEVDEKGKVLRHMPYFAELDATEKNPKLQTLLVRPAEILHDATRYVIGVRGLKTRRDKPLRRRMRLSHCLTAKLRAPLWPRVRPNLTIFLRFSRAKVLQSQIFCWLGIL